MTIDLPVYHHRAGAGPTLVFLHYWGGSARTWDAVADRLAGRDLLLVDFRGWGRSRHLAGPYTLAQHARDVVAVLRDSGVDDHVLVGHSMGGKVAQLVAADGADGLRGVVLVAPAPAVPPAHLTAAYREELSHAYDSDASTGHAADTILTASPLAPAVRARVLADSRASAPQAARAWPLDGIARDVRNDARRIAVPALVVAGERDVVERPDVLRGHLLTHLREASMTTVRGSGHLIPLEAPGALADLITAFVDRLPATQAARRGSPR